MDKTLWLKKKCRRLLELAALAAIVAVAAGVICAATYLITGSIPQYAVSRTIPDAVILSWLSYILLNPKVREADKNNARDIKMLRDVELHFAQHYPGKTISRNFSYGYRPVWYAWLRTDEKEECQTTEVGDEAHSSVIIHDLKTGRLLGNFVYPASFSRLDKDKKIALIKEKMKAAYDRPVYLTDCAANNNSQTNPFVSFETTTGDRYLETEIEADEMRIRFIHDLRTGAVVDSWTVLNKDRTIQ